MTTEANDRTSAQGAVAEIINPAGKSPVVLVCEHASNAMPALYENLGLDQETRESHIAWDPGARAVALHLSQLLDAPLVASRVSRLLYDCNRPPEAPDAMPARSEVFDVPGNFGLGPEERAARAEKFYFPFRDLLAQTIAQRPHTGALITVHSFTPTYNGQPRSAELGVLHDRDTRLADQILKLAPQHTRLKAQRNVPYGPADGVTHTLQLHGIRNGLPNAMLEIRNDLIADAQAQKAIGQELAALLSQAIETVGATTPQEAHT